MSGKPAARITDRTAHGGTIVPGSKPATRTYIGKKLAARVTDEHTCPGIHRCGKILPPCAAAVLVEGLPQARIGDFHECKCGSKDRIVTGYTPVLVGNNPYSPGARTAAKAGKGKRGKG